MEVTQSHTSLFALFFTMEGTESHTHLTYIHTNISSPGGKGIHAHTHRNTHTHIGTRIHT